jgi:adenine-specific DNA-methyltransferase
VDKLKMHSPNLTQDNIARIRELFTGCVTEARGEDGSVKLAVDFDQLRQELSAPNSTSCCWTNSAMP